MTFEEAKLRLEYECGTCRDYDNEDGECLGSSSCFEYKRKLCDSLNKQMPKKIIKDEYGRIRCPHGHNIPLENKNSRMPYCPFCGQKLNWTDIE